MATEAQIRDAMLEGVRAQLGGWFAEIEENAVGPNPDYGGRNPEGGSFIAIPFVAQVADNDRPIGTIPPTGGSASIEGVVALTLPGGFRDRELDDELSAMIRDALDIYTDTACILSQLGVQFSLRGVLPQPQVQARDDDVPGTPRLASLLAAAEAAQA